MPAKKKIETHTARSLRTHRPVKKSRARAEQPPAGDAIQTVVAKLYDLAAEGNTTAAKIYLDYMLRQKGEDTDALTPEEALRILREQRT